MTPDLKYLLLSMVLTFVQVLIAARRPTRPWD